MYVLFCESWRLDGLTWRQTPARMSGWAPNTSPYERLGGVTRFNFLWLTTAWTLGMGAVAGHARTLPKEEGNEAQAAAGPRSS